MRICTGVLALLVAWGVVPVAPSADTPEQVRKPDRAQLLRHIDNIADPKLENAKIYENWLPLANADPDAVPLLLHAMDTPKVPLANWYYTALTQVLDHARQNKLVKLDLAAVLAFARDAKRQGRARRVALEIVEERQPGTTATLLPGWLDDDEFRQDAIDAVLAQAKKLQGKAAETSYRQAFTAARDIEQARQAALGLLEHSQKVSIAEHLGFLLDWYLIGPFDAAGQQGFRKRYPPEEGVDLSAELADKEGKRKWKRFRVEEPSPRVNAKHVALVDLRSAKALGDADDAVAFAYTAIVVPTAMRVEMRGAADDNLTVWVNGTKVFGYEEYRNGVRFDRHRFPVQLRAGRNELLVKVCQTPAPNPEPNWEFLLRIVDTAGRGLRFESALPK